MSGGPAADLNECAYICIKHYNTDTEYIHVNYWHKYFVIQFW